MSYQRLCCISILLLLSCYYLSEASESRPELGPRQVVQKYIQYDYDGERVMPTVNSGIDDLTAWEIEPGWDQLVVTGKEYITDEVITANSALIKVTYHNFGIAHGNQFKKIKFSEYTTFHVARDKGVWRIVKPIFPPHVSVNSAINLFKGNLQDKESKAEQDTLNKSIAQLEQIIRKIKMGK